MATISLKYILFLNFLPLASIYTPLLLAWGASFKSRKRKATALHLICSQDYVRPVESQNQHSRTRKLGKKVISIPKQHRGSPTLLNSHLGTKQATDYMYLAPPMAGSEASWWYLINSNQAHLGNQD